ncbi:MAG: isoaspartyl peptidase/L-asparaginase, partial [Legionella sp.]
MSKFAIAVHGGASGSSPFIRKNAKGIEEGLKEATVAGNHILKKGGSALDAVETAVQLLEDNPLFNAGRGSALNCRGEVEMDASIMNGKNLKAGAVSMVRRVKNPISLARLVMNKTQHVFLSGYGALEIAENEGIDLEPESYFIT